MTKIIARHESTIATDSKPKKTEKIAFLPGGLTGVCSKCFCTVVTEGTEKNDGRKGRYVRFGRTAEGKSYSRFSSRRSTFVYQVPCPDCSWAFFNQWITVNETRSTGDIEVVPFV